MTDAIHLTVVTPERNLVDEVVDEVQVPGLNGYLGVLPGHAPLFSELRTGELTYRQRGRTHALAISRGFVEVLDNAVRVLSEVAETAMAIDVGRATQARARAEQRIAGGDGDTDYTRAQEALERAAVRLEVARKKG